MIANYRLGSGFGLFALDSEFGAVRDGTVLLGRDGTISEFRRYVSRARLAANTELHSMYTMIPHTCTHTRLKVENIMRHN